MLPEEKKLRAEYVAYVKQASADNIEALSPEAWIESLCVPAGNIASEPAIVDKYNAPSIVQTESIHAKKIRAEFQTIMVKAKLADLLYVTAEHMASLRGTNAK